MKQTHWICDRCKRDDPDPAPYLDGFHIKRVRGPYPYLEFELDLCNKCFNDLQEWVTNPRCCNDYPHCKHGDE